MPKPSPEMLARAKVLADEILDILERTNWVNRKEVADNFQEIQKRKQEIHAMGLWVNYIVKFTADLKTDRVLLGLYGPHDDMTPEEQKAYDEWFKRVNGIAPDEDKNNPA